MVWRFCAAMVVLFAWKTCHVPISLHLHPFTRRHGSTSEHRAPPLISMHGSSRGGSAIFVPPTSTSWEQEAPHIPGATGHWMVGAFWSSSPDWWMGCLTLSEQDGRCAGCGPQIVTLDCFIRAWHIELSPSWNEVPRHCSHSHLLSSWDSRLPRCSCVTKPDRFVKKRVRCPLTLNVRDVWRPGEAFNYHSRPVSFFRVPSEKAMFELAMKPQWSSLFSLWWAVGGEADEPRASSTLWCLLSDKAAFMRLSGWKVIHCVSTNHNCAAGVDFNLILWI